MKRKEMKHNINNAYISVDNVNYGNVYIMIHSLFKDVIKIGCTPIDPYKYAEELSAKTPGHYKVAFALACEKPCQVQKKIRTYLNNEEHTNEFYQVPIHVAENLFKREIFKIPFINVG